MPILTRQQRRHTGKLALMILLIMLTACQPIVDNRTPVEKAFDAGELMAINGTELFVKVVGEGEPIIMLHGGPGAEHIFFAKYTEALAEDHQLIYYDQRSTGFSIPDTDPAHLTVETFLADLDGVRQAFNHEKVTLLGWSWGGDLALLYALKYPEHLKGIILVSPGSLTGEFNDEYDAKWEERATPERTAALDAAYEKLTAEKTGEAYVEFAKVFLTMFVADPSVIDGLEIIIPDNSALYGDTVAAGIGGDLENRDLVTEIGAIQTPTFILHGDEDLIPLAAAQQIHAAVPGSQLVVFEGIGHIPFVEAPEQFYATVRDFMQQIAE